MIYFGGNDEDTPSNGSQVTVGMSDVDQSESMSSLLQRYGALKN